MSGISCCGGVVDGGGGSMAVVGGNGKFPPPLPYSRVVVLVVGDAKAGGCADGLLGGSD